MLELILGISVGLAVCIVANKVSKAKGEIAKELEVERSLRYEKLSQKAREKQNEK